MRTVLIIDDNPAVGEALSLALSLREIRPYVALTPEDGLAALEREKIDVVIQDMNFTADTTSGEEGVALFRAIRRRYPDLPVILLTAWTHLETAVELVKAGAADYLAKPWDDAKLLATVENLLELVRIDPRGHPRPDRAAQASRGPGPAIRPRQPGLRLRGDGPHASSWPARSPVRTCRC